MTEVFQYPLGALPTDLSDRLQISVSQCGTSSTCFSLPPLPSGSVRRISADSRRLPPELSIEVFLVRSRLKPGLGQYREALATVPELLLKDDSPLVDSYRQGWRLKNRHLVRSYRYQPAEVRTTGSVVSTENSFFLRVSSQAPLPAAVYQAQLILVVDGGSEEVLDVTITVLPFSLQAPSRDLVCWFRGSLDEKNSQHYLPEAVYRNQLRHIRDSGFTSIALGETKLRHAKRALAILEELGFSRNVILVPPFPQPRTNLQSSQFCIHYYVSDEPELHPETAAQFHRYRYDQASELGYPTFASIVQHNTLQRFLPEGDLPGMPSKVSLYVANNLETLQHLSAFPPPHAPAELYLYWMAHMEKPLVHRLLAGAYLWKSRAAGISPYCYQHRVSPPYSAFAADAPWEPDFKPLGKSHDFRPHMACYPCTSGSISTLQWEGMREGIIDLRYLETLATNLAQAEAAASPQVARQKAEFANLLAPLVLSDVDIDNPEQPLAAANLDAAFFEQLRSGIIRLLLELSARGE
jgi:hypothetical protein